MDAEWVEEPVVPRLGGLVAAWGLLGVAALLFQAIWRLTPVALAALGGEVTPVQWALTAGWWVFMGYSEGYKGFQRGFAPRVVARARHLASHRAPLHHVVLAPLYCMGLLHASRKRLAVSWGVVFMVIGLITAFRFIPQPYRGLLDSGVVLGLGWGLVAVAAFAVRALAGRGVDVPLDLPQRA